MPDRPTIEIRRQKAEGRSGPLAISAFCLLTSDLEDHARTQPRTRCGYVDREFHDADDDYRGYERTQHQVRTRRSARWLPRTAAAPRRTKRTARQSAARHPPKSSAVAIAPKTAAARTAIVNSRK